MVHVERKYGVNKEMAIGRVPEIGLHDSIRIVGSNVRTLPINTFEGKPKKEPLFCMFGLANYFIANGTMLKRRKDHAFKKMKIFTDVYSKYIISRVLCLDCFELV